MIPVPIWGIPVPNMGADDAQKKDKDGHLILEELIKTLNETLEKAQIRVEQPDKDVSYKYNRKEYLHIIDLTLESANELYVEIEALNRSPRPDDIARHSKSVSTQVDDIVDALEMYHVSYSDDAISENPVKNELELKELTELKNLAYKLSDAKDELSSPKNELYKWSN